MDLNGDTEPHLPLEGIHYKERKKNFYRLLKNAKPNVLMQYVDVHPKNHLEKCFHVDLLIHLRQVDKLIDIMREGNGLLTSKILKQKWFFEEAFTSMNETLLVNEFLPSLSYSLRMKVLKKLALVSSEDRMDSIFDNVLQRYGLFVAQQFLFSCSPAKITAVLKNNKLTLSIEQLKRILDKDSNLIKVYFETYKKHTGTDFSDYDFLSYLTWKYPKLYFEFAQYMEGPVKLGRMTTKTVLKIDKEQALLQDVKNIKNRLNIGMVTREVKCFDTEHLPKIFPQNMNDLTAYKYRSAICEFIRKYPQCKRWTVFSAAFGKVYNKDPLDHLNVIDIELAGHFPTEVKQKFAEIKFKETGDLIYLQYYEPKKSIVIIKERINITSDITIRCNMLTDLIKYCHTHKDYNTYAELLKYICLRHRNESEPIRDRLLSTISRNIDYELTTEHFWTYVNELIEVSRAKGDRVRYENMFQYLIFLHKNNLPLDETIERYIKTIVPDELHLDWQFWYLENEPQLKSYILRFMAKFFPLIQTDQKRRNEIIMFMSNIIELNEKHPEFRIDFNDIPFITEHLKNIIEKDVYDSEDNQCVNYLLRYNYHKSTPSPLKVCDDNMFLNCIKSTTKHDKSIGVDYLFTSLLAAIKKPRNTEFQNDLLDFLLADYFSELYDYQRKLVIEYFISEEPEIIAKYFNEIILQTGDESLFFDFSFLKLYSHLNFDSKAIEYFKPFVAKSNAHQSVRLLEELSKIMEADDFIGLINDYIPENKKLDLENSEQKTLYEIQCAIPKCMKNLTDLVKVIPLLHIFCEGDYLQSSLPLLYKVLYRIPENDARLFIDTLTDKAVSVRKHATHLCFVVLPEKTSFDVFNTVAGKEQNTSAKKYLLQSLLKYFKKNPSDYLLNSVVANLSFADKNDNELFEILTNSLEKLPDNFQCVFVEKLWNFLDVIEKQEVNMTTCRLSLLSTICRKEPEFFLSLKEAFCDEIINTFFFQDNTTLLKSGKMYEFATKHMLAYNDEKHFSSIFSSLKKYKDCHWESGEKDQLKYIFNFFDHVYDCHWDKNIQFWETFKSHWEHIFNHEECFSEYVLLRLLILCKENNSNFTTFVDEADKCFKQLILEYGPYLSDLLLESIRRCLSVFSLATSHFALELLKCNKNDFNCFIASQLITDCDHDDDVTYMEHRAKVLDILKSVNDFSVKIRYNRLLRD